MLVTAWVIRALEIRREQRRMKALGYRYHETDWEIIRGHRTGDRIIDAKVSADGLGVWTLLGNADTSSPTHSEAPCK